MGAVPSSFQQSDDDRPAERPPAGTGEPAPRAGRVVGLDVARALAIIGMIAVNVGPRGEGGLFGTLYDLPLGRSSVLFMLLAGVGMSILTRSSRGPLAGPLPWQTVVWRAALLLVGGLALQMAGHEASVILPLYGLLFIVCLPLLRAPTWLLAALSATFLVAGPILWVAVRHGTDAFTIKEPTLVDPPPEILDDILFSGSYPAVVWVAPFLLGMVLGRLDLRDGRLQRMFLVGGAVAAVGAYAFSRLLVLLVGEPGRTVGWDRLVSVTGHSQMPLWLISSTGAALCILGACLAAERFLARWTPALAAMGRLSLTVYVGHLLALAVFVRPGPGSLAGGYAVTAVLCLASLLFAWLWTRRFEVGPLEALMRLPRVR
ncbi:DUF418 domain-containing protein [Citricoccus sp.]|uniref:DUF418 domain-containing protein n=1 Tax=Citricoccus sp. TaxID=1978372 RepID=UPI002611DC0F|nr:DUF418 domain-containing protein [Citricoccus sp.]HRO30064.1 DUF418 domain-containing protein [Citricoccus sp.]HRO94553.1 DUF418 domain-containing protein [Citricoccus sp.]